MSFNAGAMVLNGSGNVGIGRTDPWKRLDVRILDTASGTRYVAHFGGNSHLTGYAIGIGLDPEGYGYRNKIGILAEGNGLGYSRGKLHIAFNILNNDNEATISDAKVTFLESGNVGIGTTSPTSKLDVYGQININSNRALARINSIDTGYNYQIVGSASGSNGGGLGAFDLRTPNPQNFITGAMTFGFTSYDLNNTANWADYIFMNSYTDSSGGEPNIFLINRNTSGVKIARQGYNSATAFNAGTIYTLNFTVASDASVKENVQNITGALDKVMQLRPVTFEWTDQYIQNGMSRNSNEHTIDPDTGAMIIPEHKTVNVGLIAQEVEAVIPTVVHQENVKLKGEENYLKNVNYDKLVPHLIAAVQELKAELDAANIKIAALESGS